MSPLLLIQAAQVITNPSFVNVSATDMQNQANVWFTWGPISFLITFLIASWSFAIFWQYVVGSVAGPAVPPGSQPNSSRGSNRSYLED